MNLGSFYTAGRGLVGVLALTAGLHCVLPPYPEKVHYQPKDDYAAYPGWEREIAFHNIKKILEESCSSLTLRVTETEFNCASSGCSVMGQAMGKNPVSGELTFTPYCPTEYLVVELQWKDIRSINVKNGHNYCLRFNKTSGDCHLYTETGKQATALKKAMEIYIRTRPHSAPNSESEED